MWKQELTCMRTKNLSENYSKSFKIHFTSAIPKNAPPTELQFFFVVETFKIKMLKTEGKN